MAVMMFVVIGGGGASSAMGDAKGIKIGLVPQPYQQWVLKAGSLCEAITPAVIAAQIEAESKWDPMAVSYAGARGPAQFMPGTWPSWGRDEDGNGVASPHDIADAVMAQGRFMCSLVDLMTSYVQQGRAQGEILWLALAAYNAGPGGVLKAGGIPFNGQTEGYVAKIRGLISKYFMPVAPSGSGLGLGIVAAGLTQLGKPYVWGGGNHHGPTGGGFDCSGLVMYALYQASGGRIALAVHLANWQVTQGAAVTGAVPGGSVDLGQLAPGDIIGFANGPGARYHHIGIYAGRGQLLHAPTFNDVVKVAPLDSAYWRGMTWNVRRFT